MEDKYKNAISQQKESWKSHIFRKPSRRRWAVVGLAASFAMLYYGLAFASGPRTGQAYFQYFGLLEGLGILFGSVAELMPEEQTTLSGILRGWASLFAICGAILMFTGIILDSGALGP